MEMSPVTTHHQIRDKCEVANNTLDLYGYIQLPGFGQPRKYFVTSRMENVLKPIRIRRLPSRLYNSTSYQSSECVTAVSHNAVSRRTYQGWKG